MRASARGAPRGGPGGSARRRLIAAAARRPTRQPRCDASTAAERRESMAFSTAC